MTTNQQHHSMKLCSRLIWSILSTLWLVGCSSQSFVPPSSKGADTPQEQVRFLYQQIVDGNQEKFVSGFEIKTADELELVRSLFRGAQATMRLREQVEKNYGDESWSRLSEPTKGRKTDSVRISFYFSPKQVGADALDLLPADAESDTYTTSALGTPPLELKRRNGWLAQPAWGLLPSAEIAKCTNVINDLTKALESHRRSLQGNSTKSFEDFHFEFANDLIDIMFGIR